MLNVLASEIEDIINLTGNISLPQIVVTIANVILLVINVILAIIKKVKKIKNEKRAVEEPTPFAAAKIDNGLSEEKKTMNTNQKIKVSIFREVFGDKDELLATKEADDLVTAITNTVHDMPQTTYSDEIKLLLNIDFVAKVSEIYEKTNNITILSSFNNICNAFGYKMKISTITTKEEIKYIDVEEPLI